MDEFLKTWYGLYPHWLDAHTFECQNVLYCIQECYTEKKQLYHLLAINRQMLAALHLMGYQPIRNLNGELLTEGKIVFAFQNEAFHLDYLWAQNRIVCAQGRTLLQLREKWIEKIEFVSQRYLYEVDCHQEQYPFRMALIQYHVGLAKSAVTVLNDLIYDYPSPLPLSQLCHRRIIKLDSACCMNPLNFVIDHPARDLCEIYTQQLVDFDVVKECFENFHYTAQEMHYFFARLLFPSWFFDVIEEDYFHPKQDNPQDTFFITKHHFFLQALKEAYAYISQSVNLKPLEW